MKVTLVRLDKASDGIFGTLLVEGKVLCVTLEPSPEPPLLPIPAGVYSCARRNSPTFGHTFVVEDVPGRTHILFHPGNRVKDTKGCILLGQYFAKLYGDRAVLNSGNTFKEFMTSLSEVEHFALEIIDTSNRCTVQQI